MKASVLVTGNLGTGNISEPMVSFIIVKLMTRDELTKTMTLQRCNKNITKKYWPNLHATYRYRYRLLAESHRKGMADDKT